MHIDPKPISREGVPAAIEKAHRYRLLNEPADAESICLDVLAVDEDNQQALETLILAITDQFDREHLGNVRRARDLVPRLDDEYRRQYFAGIVAERSAMAHLRSHAPRAGEPAYAGFREAMDHYERAEAIRPAGNDEAILRWNTCARVLSRNAHLAPAERDEYVPSFD